MLTFYVLPSVVALSLKLMIFWFGRHSFKVASMWLWLFFVGLFGVNTAELIAFYFTSIPEKGFFVLSAYYIFSVITCFSMLFLSLENAGKLTELIKRILLVCFVITVVSLLVPGIALLGVESIGYSITRIAGPYYIVVQLGVLLPLISSLLISAYYSFYSSVYSVRKKSQVLLIACLPAFISVIIIMFLMQLGFQINASVILSLMITLALLILIYTEKRECQYKFMSLIPRTKEYMFVKKLANLIVDPTVGLEQGRELIEYEMIMEALSLSGGNKIKAASILGISRQTLSRKIEKYN